MSVSALFSAQTNPKKLPGLLIKGPGRGAKVFMPGTGPLCLPLVSAIARLGFAHRPEIRPPDPLLIIKSELSQGPHPMMGAKLSSACSLPRHNRNDGFPARAEAQGAYSSPWGSLSHTCDKLFR